MRSEQAIQVTKPQFPGLYDSLYRNYSPLVPARLYQSIQSWLAL